MKMCEGDPAELNTSYGQKEGNDPENHICLILVSKCLLLLFLPLRCVCFTLTRLIVSFSR